MLERLNLLLDRVDRGRFPPTADQRPEDVPDRGAGHIPPLRGWPEPGGGRCTYLQPPREWRATSAQVCGLWPYSVGAGAPLIGAPLGRHLFSGATVCGDPISWFQRAGFIPAPTSFVLAREGFGTGLVMITHTIKDLLSVAREHEQRKALGFIERSGMLICGALPPEEHKHLRGIKGFSDAELRLITSWQDPPPWGQGTTVAPPGQGKFLIKVGDRPGIPFHVTLTRTEKRLGIHDTSKLWHLESQPQPAEARLNGGTR